MVAWSYVPSKGVSIPGPMFLPGGILCHAGLCLEGVCPLIRKAGGTHPTEMLSCYHPAVCEGYVFTGVCLSMGVGSRSLSRGGLHAREDLHPSGSLSRGVFVQRGLCPGGISVQGASLSRGVSVQGVSIQRGLCPWGSLSGRSLSRGVSVMETPPYGN